MSLNHRYSLPNKLFEYLAVGVPLVVSDNPEISRFTTEHGIGEVCDPSDPRSIAAAVLRLDASRDAVAMAARAVGATLRWETEETTLLGVYATLGT